MREGKVRAIGCSNFDAAQLQDALDVAARNNLPRYDVVQPEYNLHTRDKFEGPLAELCIREEIGVISYYALAAGFLTGKYRAKEDTEGSARAYRIGDYLNDKGFRILAALDEISTQTKAEPAAIAPAWLLRKPGLTATTPSAHSIRQTTGSAWCRGRWVTS